MKHPFKRILSALLASLMLLPLAACGDTDSGTPDTTDPAVTTPAVTTEAETTPDPNLRENAKDNLPADLNLNGAEINVLAWDHEYSRFDIAGNEDISGDIVFDAVHDRNAAVEERLNCTLNTSLDPSAKWQDFAGILQRTVASGDNTYSFMVAMGNSTIQYGNDKYFMDVSGLEYLDFEQPWWWKDSMDELSLDGETYRYLVGDMQLSNYLASGAVYFNKRLFENAIGSSDDLYKLVIDGGWTWDKLHEYCEVGAQDVNGDGIIGDGDIWGSRLGHDVLLNMMEFSSDVRRHTRDENGYVAIDYDAERAAVVTEKLYNLLYETKGFSYDKSAYTEAQPFASGNMLFYIERLVQTTEAELRDMEDDYGIIPMAKADDSQKDYVSLVQNAAMNVALPVTCPDPNATAAVLEALYAESYRSVVETFYETALKVKYSRDSYSGQCIDLIANSARRFVVYEYGFAWNNAGTVISTCLNAKNTNFASIYAKMSPAFDKLLDKYMQDFEKQKAANAAG
ncbi:MAG: hypothetical protein IJD06_05145 [Clostridia bacterium]|nr:hypothetical protein [Clostridia bacterium]